MKFDVVARGRPKKEEGNFRQKGGGREDDNGLAEKASSFCRVRGIQTWSSCQSCLFLPGIQIL